MSKRYSELDNFAGEGDSSSSRTHSMKTPLIAPSLSTSSPDGAAYANFRDDPNSGNNNNKKFEIEEDAAITDHLDGAVPLDQLIVPANITGADLAHALATYVNVHGCSASKSVVGTKLIEPGTIGIINHNGNIQVVPPGRYVVPNPRASWAGVFSLTDDVIAVESLTIIRVKKGEFGLANEAGKFSILGEGIHCRNSRLFRFDRVVPVNAKHITHGTIHLLIVPVSEYALVTENNKPKILKVGRYSIDSIFFSVSGFVPINQEHIQHGTIHIIRVMKGKVALINNNTKPMILHEGTHTFSSQVLTFHGERSVNDEHVLHGTITRFRVRNGEVGLAWDDNKPVFIETPGIYEVDSPTFSFVRVLASSEKQIQLGSRKRVVVYDGEVGISYLNGKLDILTPRAHIFDAADRVFVGFLSTRQQMIPLNEEGQEYMRCETKDFVEIGIKAAVFYRICDPEKALLTVGGSKALEKLMKETSIATLQIIVRSTTLNQVARSNHLQAVSSSSPNAPLFFDMVHDEFISRLHETFKDLYGLELANIRVESFKLMNHELSDNISKQAIITAQTENRLANLEGQRQIATAEMERQSASTMIKAQAEAAQLATDVQARNNAQLAEAQAKAQVAKIVASGEADALLIKAQAEARAVEMKASAEKKRAQEVGSTQLGSQLAVLAVQSEMVTRALGGVEKVIYLSSDANLAKAPMSLFGVDGGKYDK